MSAHAVQKAFVVIDELAKILEVALLEAIRRGEAKDIVTFTEDGVPVCIDIPGILRIEVFDEEFARRARNSEG